MSWFPTLALATGLLGLPVNYHHQPPLGAPILCRLLSGDLHPALLLHRSPLLPVLQELLEPSSQKSPPDKIDLVKIIFSVPHWGWLWRSMNDNINENAWHKSLIHKAEMPTGADNLHLSRYLRFFQFYITDIVQTSAPFAKSVNLK